MSKSKIVKNGQLYHGISDFPPNLNIPDVPPSNTASFGHQSKIYLTSHFSIGIHIYYGHCTSYSKTTLTSAAVKTSSLYESSLYKIELLISSIL